MIESASREETTKHFEGIVMTTKIESVASTSRDVTLTLPESEVRFVLFCLEVRARECRKVTKEYKHHLQAQDVDIHIERLKMQIAGQL